MKKSKNWLAVGFFLIVVGVFFWPVFAKGWLPFPGDLLAGSYNPWSSYSRLGYAPGGVPHKAQGIDVVRQLYPWKQFSIASLKEGQLPFWNPHNFAGNPHLANLQSGPFYPFNFLFWVFSFNSAWTIYILLQPFLAGLFVYLYLKEIRLKSWGALLGGLTFGFGLYLTVWLEWGNLGHALLWLPLALLAIEKYFKKAESKWLALLVFSLVLSVLAGYIQISLYVFGVAILYWLFLTFTLLKPAKRVVLLKRLILVLVLAFFLTSFQVLPALVHFSQSARLPYPPERASSLLMPAVHLVTALVPDFFGNPASRNYWLEGTYIERVTYLGVLPLFFAFLAIIFRRKEKRVLFWSGLGLLVLILTINSPVGRLPYLIKLPVFSTTVPTRLLGVFSLALAVLAGLGLDYFLRVFKKKKLNWGVLKTLLGLGGLFGLLWLAVLLANKVFPSAGWLTHLSVSRRNLILPTVIFSAWAGFLVFLKFWWPFLKKRKLVSYLPPLLLLVVFSLSVFDLYFYFQKITPFSPPEFIYPETRVVEVLKEKAGIDRFWGYGSGYVDSNLATQLGLYSVNGYDPLFSQRYGQLLSASDNGQIKEVIPRSDVVLERGFGNEALRQNPYRQQLLNLLGVKYLLQKDEGLGEKEEPNHLTFPQETYQLIWQESPWQIYENKMALPRVFLVGDYQVEENPQRIVDLIFNSDFPLEKKLILEEPLSNEFTLDREASGEIKDLDYQPNRVELTVETSGNSLLFLSDNYENGWRAWVDDQETKIYRADYSFRAIIIPAGEHRVVFRYRPRSFSLGLFLSLIGLGIMGAFLIKERRLK